MPQQTPLSEDVLAQIEHIQSADIMVGIPSYKNALTIPHVVKAATAGLVQYFPELKPVLVNSDGGSPDQTRELVISTESPDYIEKIILVHPAHRLQRVSMTYQGVAGKGSAMRAIFEIARRLRVKACVVVDSDLRSIVPEWIELLAGPIVKGGYDYVAPLYSRHKYDGTITNMIAYPLTRALYGKRIRQPIGGDFGISSDLIAAYLESDLWDDYVSMFGIDIWMTTLALTQGFAACQAILGAKVHDAKDPGSDLGPMFRQVVGTLFRLGGAFAEHWAGTRGSRTLPEYGFERIEEPPAISVSLEGLLDHFREGAISFSPVWRQVLDDECLHGVTRCVNLAPDRFYFPVDLWIKVVYRFLVAYNAHPALGDQIVNALTPLYFGRTASFVNETRELSAEQAEQIVERQALDFERLKPYLATAFEKEVLSTCSEKKSEL